MKILPQLAGLIICVHLIQSKMPLGKRQREMWRLECELGVIVDSECPVDGGWSPWTVWSNCQGTCDDIGHRTRTRECNNPVPSKDGIPCAGSDEQIETCYIMNCSVEDFRKLVEGDAHRTEAFHRLETVPALLERCLQMECPYEAIEAALSSDNTWQLNSEVLWNALQCVKHNLGCPIQGEWSVWGSWSACGARCGKGLRWRLRRCDTPPPSEATLTCTGTPLQSEECEGDQCAIEGRYVEYSARGTWSEWGQWSPCSEVCGTGVRRRKRTCHESNVRFSPFTWGTHCRGQHDQLEICIISACSLDGGWSGWGPWGPCTCTCGPGHRSRTRSCTRPVPSDKGNNCDGPRIETGSCNLGPCKAYTHLVALLNGDSHLQYNLSGKRSTLFHFYIRFRSLSPSGTLVRRGSLQSPYVRLSLQKWHVCLDASGMSQSCDLFRMCTSTPVEPAVWHTVLITVSSESATMRLDDALNSVKGYFPCEPELENSLINIYVGERFSGEIQELILNFNPLKLLNEKDNWIWRSNNYPSFSSNIAYEKANKDEAFLNLEHDQYIRLPCFDEQDNWRMELAIKPKRDSGIILFLLDSTKKTWFYMALLNMRLKIKLAVGEIRSESSSSTDYQPSQWLHITLAKNRGTNTIESVINGGEKLHLLMAKDNDIKSKKAQIVNNQINRENKNNKSDTLSICNDEFFLGDIPAHVKNYTLEDVVSFSGTIAYLTINEVLVDLYNCSIERYKDTSLQLSSRTASVSRSYQEIEWGSSNSLNLTCLHARVTHKYKYAHWFFLDTTISEVLSDKNIRFVDDPKMLRLTVATDNDLKGFYTCRAHINKLTYNIITYGVIGPIKYNLSTPDLTTLIAVFTTTALVVYTLGWLILEGVSDLRNGYGFFRDAHLTPQEEADAVCKFIDQNVHIYSSKSAVKLAKAKAKRKARHLASRMSFGTQEPQGLLQVHRELPDSSNESELTELVTLPALPVVESSRIAISNGVYRCEQSYNNSPRHESSESQSSLSIEMSPRVLCSRLLLTKYKSASKGSVRSRKRKKIINGDNNFYKSKLCTIKTSTFKNLSPVQKVLQKFYELKTDD